MRRLPLLLACLFVLVGAPAAGAYSWPLKPFDRPHPIRGSFGDPRYHLGEEGELSAFHFGVDIAAPDGTRVYSVAAGYVHAYRTSVTVTSRRGREFGYWHVRPLVHTGQHVRRHQLIGVIRPRWGHVHFAESYRGAYKDPLRKGALTPYYDRTAPTIASVQLLSPTGGGVDLGNVTGTVSMLIDAYDTPPLPPRPPWQVARLVPSALWWTVTDANGVTQSQLVADFGGGLLPNPLYPLVYAAGTWQNKANRPGHYLFWGTRDLDTTTLPDGWYDLSVTALDTRGNIGTSVLRFRTANGVRTVQAYTSLVRGLRAY